MIGKLGLNTSAPYHLLLYSFVFGGSTFHTFFGSIVAFKHLSRSEFSKLQNNIFPSYFLGQTVSPILLGLTAPFALCPCTLGFLSIASLSAAANYFLLLPLCQKVQKERNKLSAEKKHIDERGEPTAEYSKLNGQFGKYHGATVILNFASIISLGLYGIILSKRLIKVPF